MTNLTLNKILIHDFEQRLSKIRKSHNKTYVALLDAFSAFKIKVEQSKKEYSSDFNTLSFFKIDEKKHSELLAELLNPNGKHGQGDLFLNSFMQISAINLKDTKNKWIVTAEKGRIDIRIKAHCPHSVIIIENKSNFAGDQENQLYRYWYQEIFLPNKNNTILAEDSSRYKIIYLSPADWKIPTDLSITKPINWNEDWAKDLPDKIPIQPIILQFDREIIKWLKDCESQLTRNNYRLKEFINQYIEIWK